MKSSEEIRKFVFQKCREKWAVVYVNQEYYEWFLALPDKSFRVIIRLIIRDRVESLNRIVSDGSKSDSDLINLVKGPLYLISEGVLQFNSETGYLAVFEPLGNSQDADTQARISRKIESLDRLISDVILDLASKYPLKS